MLNFPFVRTSLPITRLNFFKSTGAVFNLPESKSATFIFKLLKQVGILVISLMPNLSNSAFKVMKYFLAAKSNDSMPVPYPSSF